MDWFTFAEIFRLSKRYGALFVWTLLAIIALGIYCKHTGTQGLWYLLGPFAVIFLVYLRRRTRGYNGRILAELPPLSREDIRVARSKLRNRSSQRKL